MNKIKIFLPSFLWLVLITVLSVMPGKSMPKFNLISADKFGHAFVYGILALLLLRMLEKNRGMVRGWQLWALLSAAAYGVLMEFVQYTFCPGRFYEYDDMLANAIGALLGWGFWRMFYRHSFA